MTPNAPLDWSIPFGGFGFAAPAAPEPPPEPALPLPKALHLALERDRLPHALLLESPEEAAGEETARTVAAALLCPNRRGARPCGVCASCTSFQAGGNPDLLLVEPEGATVKIEQIRALKEAAQLSPMGGHRRAALLRRADLMTVSAQNALLKLLEEPPAHLTFLLTAQRAGALLPTILSRVTRIPLSEGGEERQEADLTSATTLLERLTAGDYYGTLALGPAMSSKKENFLGACDALALLCHKLMTEKAGGAPSPLAARLPARAAGELFHLALSYRQKGEGTLSLPLLAAAMLIECWEVLH